MELVHADSFLISKTNVGRKNGWEKLQIQLGILGLIEEEEKEFIFDLKLQNANNIVSGISSGTAMWSEGHFEMCL